MVRHSLLLWVVSAAVSGCINLAPEYQRPAPAVPVEGQANAQHSSEGLPELGWQSVYVDPRVRQVIELTLANNRDLRWAALNVERARSLYQVQKAAGVPGVGLDAAVSRGSDLPTQFSANLGLTSFELDFFGRVRNLNESALRGFLQSEESRRTLQTSLVAESVNAWLNLAVDLQREQLAQRTLESLQQSYELTQTRHRLGAVSGLPLSQARTALENARVDLAGYAAQIAQDRNALVLLAGAAVPDELLPRSGAAPLPELALLPAPPTGVPSAVLQRRPDVLAAEQALQAANADVGAARAAMFPRIALTGSVGGASNELSSLFSQGAWRFGPSLTLPIFDGGANRARRRAAEVGRDMALAQYDKAVQSAFREVADALAVSSTLAERLSAQNALREAARHQLNLAEASHRAGDTSQLDLLDAQRSLYAAEQSLLTLRQTAQANRITLYKVLGGGWKKS